MLSKINSLRASGGTNANSDIQKGIDLLSGTTEINKKMLRLICDGDGLYDVYEVNEMRLSNGQIVYTDPNNQNEGKAKAWIRIPIVRESREAT